MEVLLRRFARPLVLLAVLGVLLGTGAHAALHSAGPHHGPHDKDHAACLQRLEDCDLCAVRLAEPPAPVLEEGPSALARCAASTPRTTLLEHARVGAHGTRGPPER